MECYHKTQTDITSIFTVNIFQTSLCNVILKQNNEANIGTSQLHAVVFFNTWPATTLLRPCLLYFQSLNHKFNDFILRISGTYER